MSQSTHTLHLLFKDRLRLHLRLRLAQLRQQREAQAAAKDTVERNQVLGKGGAARGGAPSILLYMVLEYRSLRGAATD